ncbi:inositol monophosphatase family protein [Knoellia subterranea]|uniref:Inositol-1-monophosphatase n=1 Tax=Knoellia subterranea KCTC 19937 TaxID=1385521 RepID=A0A0A0JSF3_9MICO|nr:inositol monophosphatase family protein [Knoellia subterranea]KGN38521.1 inositol-phosphate phosphatase [Knoellia subterranea KCTC 19937]
MAEQPQSPALPATDLIVELEALAIDLARTAGRLVVDERPDAVEVAETKSTATDVVTVMDQRSQDHLIARIREARPDDAVLGEERGGVTGTSSITWVIDPIDGTVNYLYGIPAYAVSVAAVVGDPTTQGAWRPFVGAVHNPVSGELFCARSGGGARLLRQDGTESRLSPTSCTEVGQALMGTGFGYAAQRRERQARLLLDLLPMVRDIRRIGSAALDLCAIGAGTLDAYYETGLNPWDLAAGWLVATEAGASVGGFNGPGESLTWACAPGLAGTFPGLVEVGTSQHLQD